MVFFHENAGNLGLRLDYLQTVYNDLNCDVLIIAYRGYSHSTGVPSEKGLNMDARAIISHALLLNEENDNWYSDHGGVFVLGRSLGGAVAA